MNNLPNEQSMYRWNNRLTGVTIVAIIFMIIVAILMSEQSEAIYLKDLGLRHGVPPNREALRDFITEELEARKGASYSDIHMYLDSIGGEIRYSVEAPLETRKIERVTWIMASESNRNIYFSEWILEYDRSDKLINITVSSSS
jgi:hypothetical protein